MTIHEMRVIYPNYAKKEAIIAKMEKWRAIYESLDIAARDGTKDEPDARCELGGPVLVSVTRKESNADDQQK